MSRAPMCSECAAGEVYDTPAVALVKGSMVTAEGRYRPFRKNVCASHLDMLSDDTPRLQVVRRYAEVQS